MLIYFEDKKEAVDINKIVSFWFKYERFYYILDHNTETYGIDLTIQEYDKMIQFLLDNEIIKEFKKFKELKHTKNFQQKLENNKKYKIEKELKESGIKKYKQ